MGSVMTATMDSTFKKVSARESVHFARKQARMVIVPHVIKTINFRMEYVLKRNLRDLLPRFRGNTYKKRLTHYVKQ